jgi:hypothetical protein
MKEQANQHKTKIEFEIGDWVFVKLQPYKKLSLKKKGNNKLTPRLYRPYEINKKISQVAYGLDLPTKSFIHNFFHASYLKKVLGKHHTSQTTLPMLNGEGKIVLEP